MALVLVSSQCRVWRIQLSELFPKTAVDRC